MGHQAGDFWEKVHHFLYRRIRGKVYENQYVGTVKVGEEELERKAFHQNQVHYNWLAYWKKHADDGRNSIGSWKLRHPVHKAYVDEGMQVHLTLFRNETNDEWVDVYAHYEYSNIEHPIKHVREVNFSADEGVRRARQFFRDATSLELYHLRD